MKPLLTITIAVAAFFLVAAGLIAVVGVRFSPADPIAAALISIGGGLAGMLPIVASRRGDPVGVFQMALVGTVLHMVVCVGLAGTAFGMHIVPIQMSFMYWLLPGYCISLAALVWQLRRVLLNTIGIKAQ